LVLRGDRGREFVASLDAILRRIRDRSRLGPIAAIATTQRQRDIYQVCQDLVRYHWKRQLNLEISDDEVIRLFSVVRVVGLAVDGATKEALQVLLAHSVTASASAAQQALEALSQIAGEYSVRRSGGDTHALRDQLRSRGVALLEEIQYQSDIARLQEITRRSLEALAHYGYIAIQEDGRPQQRISLSRSCTDALANSAKTYSFLLIGEPGSGKSGALQAAAQKLIEGGHPAIVLAVDQISASSLDELQGELNLAHPVIDILLAWHPSQTPVVFIDALDASRGGISERAISELILAVIEKVPHWHVVASIRKFDLRYGAKYQRLFAGKPVDANFVDSEFINVTHLNVPPLTDDEIRALGLQWPRLKLTLSTCDVPFRQLLRNPFNLLLLATILMRSTSEKIGSARTQLDLLQQYWLHWVDGHSPAEGIRHGRVLHSIVDEMMTQRRLFADSNCVSPALLGDLAELLRRAVLVQPSISTRVSFSHHVLFDFALAKLKLLADGVSTIRSGLTNRSDDMLLIAPAAMLALRVLWEEDADRRRFWNLALDLATTDCGEFARSLPARVAAEAVATVADFAPVIEGVSDIDETKRHAALFLIRHTFSVLLAQVVKNVPDLGNEADPWCAIAKSICARAMKDVVWPMKAVIGQWATEDQSLTLRQVFDLGECARLMLDASLAIDLYDEGAVSSAISGIIRTFHSNEDESDRSLRKLLDPVRIAKYGHRELFWFARGFRQIAESRPLLAGQLICSVYTTALPSSEEKTSLNQSRIMGLTSNKRQDFEGIRYLLNEHLSWFLVHSAQCATAAIRHVLLVAGEDERDSDNDLVDEAVVAGQRFRMHTDHSCIWWTDSAHHHDVRASVLNELVKALTEISEVESRLDLPSYANMLLQGDVWASSVAAFIKAMTRSTSLETSVAVDFLVSRPILSNIDTSYLAGELLKKFHPILSDADRRRVELSVGSLDDQDTKARLLGCMDSVQIGDPDTRALRQAIEAKQEIPPNVPPFRMDTSWGSSDENWWLKDQGVDVDAPLSRNVLEAVRRVTTKDLSANREQALELLTENWPNVQKLAELLESNLTMHDQLLSQGMDALADACLQATGRCGSTADLAKFPGIRRYIDLCLRPTLEPLPVFDKKTEEQFEMSASWGRPAPRIPAAEALMSYVRASGVASENDRVVLLDLARDLAVAVRHTVLARANVVSVAAPDLSHALATVAFDEEKNSGVISFFLASFYNFLGTDVEWAASKLLELDRQLGSPNEDRRDHVITQLAGLLLRLWVTWDIATAGERLNEWADSSIEHNGRISSILVNLRQLVNFGDGKERNDRDEAIRRKGQLLFSRIVENLASSHEILMNKAIESGAAVSGLPECTRLLDTAARELYFGSGAYDRTKSPNNEGAPRRDDCRHFLIEYLTILNRLARIPHPSVTHSVLQTIEAFIQDEPIKTLELLLEAVRTGGRDGGYTSESMGADLVVKLIRRFLADYPSLIANTPRFRQGVLEALDLFAIVGWPEARKLVYTLPEMLR